MSESYVPDKLNRLLEVIERKNVPLSTYIRNLSPEFRRELSERHWNVWVRELEGIESVHRDVSLAILSNTTSAAQILAPSQFGQWQVYLRKLACFQVREATSFSRSSLKLLQTLPHKDQERVLSQATAMLALSWEASLEYFQAFPEILYHFRGEMLDNWELAGLVLAELQPDTAAAYFKSGPAFFNVASSHDLLKDWADYGRELIPCGREVAGQYFLSSPEFLAIFRAEEQSTRLGDWVQAIRLMAADSETVAATMLKASIGVFKLVPISALATWIEVGKSLLVFAETAAIHFYQSSPTLLRDLNMEDVASWAEYGVEIANGDRSALVSYLSLSTGESKKKIQDLRGGIRLKDVHQVLATYTEAMLGRSVIIRPITELPEQLHKWNKLMSTGDGKRVYLPERLDVFPDDARNMRLYKMMLMHELARQDAGTYEFGVKEQAASESEAENLAEWLLSFSQIDLAQKIFAFLEGKRISAWLLDRFPGVLQEITAVHFYPREETTAHAEIVAGNITSLAEVISLTRNLYSLCQKPGSSLAGWFAERKGEPYLGEIRPELVYIQWQAVSESITVETEQKSVEYFRTLGGILDAGEGFITRFRQLLQKFAAAEEQNQFRDIRYYNEWDYTLNDYREKWCRVREMLLPQSSGRVVSETMDEYYGLISSLKKQFAMLRPDRLRRFHRQTEGDDLDINAVVDAMVALKTGMPSHEGLYVRRDKRLRDVAVAFLLDLSQSTEQVINDAGKTILRVEIEAAALMAEALEAVGDRYAIYGFSSDGREKIDFYVIKDFNEDYSLAVKQRFGGLYSARATRLGAAIRHASHKLRMIPAAVNLLVVLSDGRPYDYDYRSQYEPTGLRAWLKYESERYAQEDVRVALREAKNYGITPFCLTVDKQGKDYLEEIFGQVSYEVISEVESLPVKLPEVYKKLTT